MSESIVVDASVAFKWLIYEEYSDEARSLLLQWRTEQIDILAPSWFMFEIVNILYKYIRRGELTLAEGIRLIGVTRRLDIRILEYDQDLHVRALEITNQFRLSAAYDAHYLALAERLNCELWTAEERLWNSVRASLGWVRWIGEPPLASA